MASFAANKLKIRSRKKNLTLSRQKSESDCKQPQYAWGIGIEQEVALLYDIPHMLRVSHRNSRPYPVKEAVSLSSNIRNRLMTLMDRQRYPMDVAPDHSSDERPFIEFITRDFAGRQLWQYVADLVVTREQFISDVNFMVLPYDSSRLAVLPETGADYVLSDIDKRFVDIPRYLGSHHINITLPHTMETDESQFRTMHIKAAMALQWLEPLFLSALGCPSPASVLDGHQVTEMSLRHAEEPLAMALARDLKNGFPVERRHNELRDPVRHLRKQVRRQPYSEDRDISLDDPQRIRFDATDTKSRRKAVKVITQAMKKTSDTFPDWLKTIFRNSLTSPMALKHFVRHRFAYFQSDDGWLTLPVVGTDFRRDVQKGRRFGFEFRLLDLFPTNTMLDLLRLMFYVMDCSASWRSCDFDAFKCHEVHEQYLDVILEGWNTTAHSKYIRKLEEVFDLNTSIKADTCYDALVSISELLFDRFGNGKGIYSRYVDLDKDGNYHKESPVILNVNRSSWDKFFEKAFPDVAGYARQSSNLLTEDMLAHVLKGRASKEGIKEDLPEIIAYQLKHNPIR